MMLGLKSGTASCCQVEEVRSLLLVPCHDAATNAEFVTIHDTTNAQTSLLIIMQAMPSAQQYGKDNSMLTCNAYVFLRPPRACRCLFKS